MNAYKQEEEKGRERVDIGVEEERGRKRRGGATHTLPTLIVSPHPIL